MSVMEPDEGGKSDAVPEAVRWFLTLREEGGQPPGPEVLDKWERFVDDPAHRREIVAVQAVWQGVTAVGGPRMPSEAELMADDFDGSMSVEEWQARRVARRSLASRRTGLFLLAAGLVIAVVGTSFFRWPDSEGMTQAAAFATPVAEQRTLELADGSIVILGARTEVQTKITRTERVVVLHSGEAWFKVAHDRQRPFSVIAGAGVITALGTEFNVRRDMDAKLDQVTVTVGSGAVKVEPRTGPELPDSRTWMIAKLESGQEFRYYNRTGMPGEIERVDIEAAAAWQEGRLEYIHQPLRTVIARVNRYSEKPIVLADDAVGEIDFSGTVFEGQIDDWIRALQTAFPVSVTETDDRILLRAR
jgi:transmembrane sensor